MKEAEDLRTGSFRGKRSTDTVAQVIDQIHQAILTGRLVPGEKIRQDALASQLGVSKVPIREALKTLVANGLLTYTHNSGFSVVRLSPDSLTEIYKMRELIEDDVMDPLPIITHDTFVKLWSINERISEASKNVDITAIASLNHEFHFTIFRLLERNITLTILSQLWDLCAPYHSTYLFDERARQTVIDDHNQLIDALYRGDAERYRAVAHKHRDSAHDQVQRVLFRSPAFLRLSDSSV